MSVQIFAKIYPWYFSSGPKNRHGEQRSYFRKHIPHSSITDDRTKKENYTNRGITELQQLREFCVFRSRMWYCTIQHQDRGRSGRCWRGVALAGQLAQGRTSHLRRLPYQQWVCPECCSLFSKVSSDPVTWLGTSPVWRCVWNGRKPVKPPRQRKQNQALQTYRETNEDASNSETHNEDFKTVSRLWMSLNKQNTNFF